MKSKQAAIQGAVLDRFQQMVGSDRGAAFQVGDGAGDQRQLFFPLNDN